MAEPQNVVAEVIGETELAHRIAELGTAISQDYAGKRPVLVAVLNGALWFLADLVRAIDIEVEVDFLALNRFGEGGRIRIAMDTYQSLAERHVIVVEDIVDTGLSLMALHRLLRERQPASLATAALLDKVSRRLVDTPLEYRGFEVGDEFLIGYGLDWEGHHRNLPGVWAVLDLAAFAGGPGVLFQAGDNLPA
ncbi:MAG: hypoxanthine phosphoribosyltransferase [Acidimicrobiia bacterium]|jgi:hypoxanthine phosphoribosyltransferase